MSGSFFGEAARTAIVRAVQDVESQSSVEIVVSIRGRSDDYREVDLVAGFLLAIATLAVFIYHPAELDENLMPIETALAFAAGSLLVNKVGAIKRRLLSRREKTNRTLMAARAHFVEAGISRTRERSGILVFVSVLERTVCVVTDIGVDATALGEGWTTRLRALEEAAARLDAAAFVSALSALGPLFRQKYPRRADDVNELPDAPMMSAS